MTYVKVNVLKPTTTNPGVGGNRKDLLTFIDLDEVNSWPARGDGDVAMVGNIAMNSGKYMVQVYGTITTIEDGFNTEGDPDKRGFKHMIKFEHPGDGQDILEFIQHWTNRNIAVIAQRCDGSHKKVLGLPCSPLQLSPEATNNSKGNTNVLTCEAIVSSGYVPGIYSGTLTLPSATGTFAADDATPSVANGEGRYELADNTGANEITSLDDAVNGKVYTLVGLGGSNPSTVTDDNDFILAAGATWTATSGSELTVKAMEVVGGAFKFIEQSRI